VVFPELRGGVFAADSLEDFLSARVLGLKAGEGMLGRFTPKGESKDTVLRVGRQGKERTL